MLSLYLLFCLLNAVARTTELKWHEIRNGMMIMNYVGSLEKSSTIPYNSTIPIHMQYRIKETIIKSI
jgi:hypothetical protein